MVNSFLVVQSLSHVRLVATPWTVALQAPLSSGFSRQECWGGLLFPSPGDLPDLAIELVSPVLAGRLFSTEPPEKPMVNKTECIDLCGLQVFTTGWHPGFQLCL